MDKSNSPATEDEEHKKANKGNYIYTCDEPNRMASSNIAKEAQTNIKR